MDPKPHSDCLDSITCLWLSVVTYSFHPFHSASQVEDCGLQQKHRTTPASLRALQPGISAYRWIGARDGVYKLWNQQLSRAPELNTARSNGFRK